MEQVLNMIGLARRAKGLVAGHAACVDALKHKKAALLILAADASEKTKKEFQEMAGKQAVPVLEIANQLALGTAIGKAPHAVIALVDQGLARRIRQLAEL